MEPRVCLDTGPLVAFFNRRDQWHSWAVEQFSQLKQGMITCESVLSEVLFLTNGRPEVFRALQGMMSSGMIIVEPVLSKPENQVWNRLMKYADINGGLADICLIHLYELEKNSRILTLDSDFQVYRDKKNRAIKLIYPKG